MNPIRKRSIAIVADRFGRNPYEHDRKSASKIGSSTILAAAWATRSRTVGIPNGRIPPSWFRDLHPPHRRRAIHTLAKVTTQLTQHAVHAVVLHRGQGDTIHPGRTPVLPHPLPRLPQDVTPVDTVVQGVETPTLRLLGRSP